MIIPICFFPVSLSKDDRVERSRVSFKQNCDSAQVMAASNAGAFRGARISSTWIPRRIRNIIACSQTLYFFLRDLLTASARRYWWGKKKVDVLYFSFSRSALASLASSTLFSKRTKRKIKQRLCTGQEYNQRGTKNTGPVHKLSP